MIRPIDIKLNAAHPELPLVEATTFTGAPSSVFIRGVPKAVGNWSITAVNVAVTYPDNSTTTRAAVESAEGVWVATIPGTATSGRTVAGFRILADGIDENGAAVTGYVLGFADFAVLSFFPVPAPGETFFYLRYFDTMPTTAKKMDVTTIDGILKYYNGTAWLPFADLTNYYTKAETDEAIDKLAAYYITADAQGNPFATHAALVNAQTYYSGGAVRTPTRNDYAVVSADEMHGGAEWRYIYAVDAQGVGQWEPQYAVEGVIAYDNTVTPNSGNGVKSSGIWSAIWGALSALPTGFSSLYDWCVSQLAGKASTVDATLINASNWVCSPAKIYGAPVYIVQDLSGAWYPTDGEGNTGAAKGDAQSLSLSWTADEWYGGVALTATRVGYVLGSQTDKPLASEAEAEALRQGKLDKSGDEMTGALRFGYDTAGFAAIIFTEMSDGTSIGSYGVKRADQSVGVSWPFRDGTLALIQDIADNFSSSVSYDKDSLCSYNSTIYRCTNPNGHTGAWVDADFAVATVEDVLAALRTAIAGKADVSAIPYTLGTPTVISTASSEVVEGETVYYGAAPLANRTANIVQVTGTTLLDELRITFPAATSGKVRDFGLRVEIGTGSAALTAPALVPIAPTGETIKIENADGTIPELADGTATAKGVTLLYFSENAPGVFVVKGEQVEEVA